MTAFEIVLFAAVALALGAAVYGVHRLPRGEDAPSDFDEDRHFVEPPAAISVFAVPAPPVVEPAYVPPDGSIMAAQLEVGQTFGVVTESATYTLTLRDPVTSLYDAVRVRRSPDGKVKRERFLMLFCGTFVLGYRLMSGWFIVGGRLTYTECKDEVCRGPVTSTNIRHIAFSIPLKQAS